MFQNAKGTGTDFPNTSHVPQRQRHRPERELRTRVTNANGTTMGSIRSHLLLET